MRKSTGSTALVPAKGTRRRGSRKEVIGGSVTRAEKAEIEQAIDRAGFGTASEGVRFVLLNWAQGKLVEKAAA